MRNYQIRNSDERRQLVDAWHVSGLSRAAFCRKHGIRYYTFYAWTHGRNLGERNDKLNGKRAELPRLLEQGLTPYQASIVLEVSPSSTRKWAQDMAHG